MADVFISYSRDDSTQALSLAEHLRRAGASVWIDQMGIEGATSWSKEIADALEDCSAFVILLSGHSVSSENVAKELAIAAKLRKRIVPVRLERVQLKGEFLYHLTSLQHVEVTNIDSILRAAGGHRSSDSPDPIEAAAPDIPTANIRVAVLPFEDQSQGHDHEWFSDGLTDELISTLNKLDALFVLDRRSSQVYKDAKLPIRQIAQDLGVAYVVTGAVRKAGDKVRVQASLVDAASGGTIWDEKFTGTMDDIFDIQERTALDICQGLKLTLTSQEISDIEERWTENIEAYELFLRHTNVGSAGRAEMLERIELLNRAVALDPKFARAYAAIAVTCANFLRSIGRDPAVMEQMERATQKTSELAPGTRIEYHALSNLYSVRGQTDLAIETAKKMVAVSPKHSIGYGVVGFMYLYSRRYDEAIRWISRALEMDPSMLNDHANLFSCYRSLGDAQGMATTLNRAAPRYQKFLALHPSVQPVRISFILMLALANRYTDCMREVERLIALPDAYGGAFLTAASVYAKVGNTDRAIELMRKAAEMGEFDADDVRNDLEFWANLHALPNFEQLFTELQQTALKNRG